MQRKGLYPPPAGASDLPGLEVAGEIVAVGDGVRDWQGRRSRLCAGGRRRLRHVCVAPAPQCLPIPRGMDLGDRGRDSRNVLHRVDERLRSRPAAGWRDARCFTAAPAASAPRRSSWRRPRGARVFATAGSDEKCRACESLGADAGDQLPARGFRRAIRDLTDGRGVDLVLDIVGGSYVGAEPLGAGDGRPPRADRTDGRRRDRDDRFAPRPRPTADDDRFDAAAAQRRGERARSRRRSRREVWPLLENGVVEPVIHATFPLRDAAEAHRMMETSDHVGKLVLTLTNR